MSHWPSGALLAFLLAFWLNELAMPLIKRNSSSFLCLCAWFGRDFIGIIVDLGFSVASLEESGLSSLVLY